MGEPHIVVESRMQATTPDILDDIRDVVENGAIRQITNESAMGIAAHWASPIGTGRTLATLASTGRAPYADVLSDISACMEDCEEWHGKHSDSWLMLTFLQLWAMNRPEIRQWRQNAYCLTCGASWPNHSDAAHDANWTTD